MKKTFAIVAIAGLAAVANADVLAGWTFETSLPANAGPHGAELGAGTALGFHAGASTYSNPVGNGSAESFSSNNWVIGDYYQFSASTLGFTNIGFGWDQVSSGTGPRDFGVFASTDGVNFAQIGGTFAIRANTGTFWSSGAPTGLDTYSVSGPGSLDNQAEVTFRIVQLTDASANGGVVASGGTSRVDDVFITGDVVPTPGAVALLGLGGLFAGRRRR